MNILEAITNASTTPIELSDKYIARIYVEGEIIYEKPVDIRLSTINVPLNPSNLHFIYDKQKTSNNVHRCDSICKYYYPINGIITLHGGIELVVLSYGTPSVLNGQFYVDVFTKLKNEEQTLIETIDNTVVKKRVINELNAIVESNEVIKSLLPAYSYNWLTFNDEDLEAVKKFNATKLLRLIDKLADDEMYFYMANLSSMINTSYTTLPTSFITYANKAAKIEIKDKVQCGYCGVHSYYNPRYVFEWLIYIFENNLIKDETQSDEFYLLNKSGLRTKIIVTKDFNTYKIDFETPNECAKNFKLIAEEVASSGSYIEYNIQKLTLTSKNKETGEVRSYPNVDGQADLLEAATQVVSILSATNIPTGLTVNEYYENIDIYLDNMESDFKEPEPEIPDNSEEAEN